MDDPRAQEQMLDLFGEKDDELLNRVREIVGKIPAAESGITKTGRIWGPRRLKELVNIVARSKSVDELAGQIHGMRGKGTQPRDLLDETGFTPVSIDNLRATLLQAPESPQRTAAIERLNKFSKEVSGKSKGRFTRPLGNIKTKRQLGDPQPELLEQMMDRLVKPINPEDKATAHVEELRQLFKTTKAARQNDPSKLKAIQAAGERAKGPTYSQSMIDMLQELLGQ